jgi:hypothetical protein
MEWFSRKVDDRAERSAGGNHITVTQSLTFLYK